MCIRDRSSLFDLAGIALPWDDEIERPLPDRVMSPWMKQLDDGPTP